MTPETKDHGTPEPQAEQLPFPYNQSAYCRYEKIEKRVETARVLVINNLLQNESDLSEVARKEWGASAELNLARERYISGLAIDNILSNVRQLVRRSEIEVAHLSQAVEAAESFRPQALVLSGTLSDFDYYAPEMIEEFAEFVRRTTIPVLGICGGHQLVGQSFGARLVTLDGQEPHVHRTDRSFEYQYRFIRITDPDDPIFDGIHEHDSPVWQDYTTTGQILRVWQNHGLQLDRVPEGFRLLATAYLCKNQMMVKRSEGQLIYTVQFHLEKSFQDLSNDRLYRISPKLSPAERKRLLREEASSRTRWSHVVESRDGRVIFENFLRLAVSHDSHAG